MSHAHWECNGVLTVPRPDWCRRADVGCLRLEVCPLETVKRTRSFGRGTSQGACRGLASPAG
jgi:hypothetical protein